MSNIQKGDLSFIVAVCALLFYFVTGWADPGILGHRESPGEEELFSLEYFIVT